MGIEDRRFCNYGTIQLNPPSRRPTACHSAVEVIYAWEYNDRKYSSGWCVHHAKTGRPVHLGVIKPTILQFTPAEFVIFEVMES